MSEWKGPWKCERCGSIYYYPLPRHHYSNDFDPCDGEMEPYDRRARSPSVDLIRELIAALQAATLPMSYEAWAVYHKRLCELGIRPGLIACAKTYLMQNEKQAKIPPLGDVVGALSEMNDLIQKGGKP